MGPASATHRHRQSQFNCVAAFPSAADFGKADLSGAKLQKSRLIRAKLDGAKLSEALLIGARLDEASLSGADLSAFHPGDAVSMKCKLIGDGFKLKLLQSATAHYELNG